MMDEATLTALKACVEKYRAYSRKHTFAGVHLGPDTCALCQIYNKRDGENCQGCPVMEKTTRTDCINTPYIDVVSKVLVDIKGFRKACAEEADFLESLIPPENPPCP